MSFDELDWDDVDPGDDEEEPEDWEDGWDDEPEDWERDEPSCYSCNDAGGRCCEPTRLDVLRWRLRSRVRDLLDKLRHRPVGTGPDEPPF